MLAWKLARHEDHFGRPFAGHPAARIADLVARPEDHLGKALRIRGRLQRQCPATGCWFDLTDPSDPENRALKVEMGDTTPRLPPRLGRFATVEGQLIRYGEGVEFVGVAVTFEE